MRTTDVSVVDGAIDQVRHQLKGEPVGEWLACPLNIALSNDGGDVALFEYRQPGVYTGHYFFHSRGKEAVSAAKGFLTEVAPLGIRIIIGMIPKKHKGSCWLTRHLGFTIVGEEVIDNEPHMIAVLHT